ncbi:MAG: transketolase [Candidatus Rokubacteria bacterium 13_1_40CM_68_15]|nr:MAG: transketolase [Candidatus Rokubacteria bacterium 13_1_40CM_68_15]
MREPNLDELAINTIRFLSVDAVQRANSGHPGLPMGAAAMAYVLWTRFLRHSPSNPTWPDRDRFVLSAGHGSMLLYSLLHLSGYDLSLEQIKRFREWGSQTPGHPEYHLTPGVEATTGPLGQGIANAVGMAIAEAHLAARFNRPGHEIIDHRTYVIASDGDMMEGVQAEASSLAGHLKLGKLIVLYDSNHVSLSGTTSLTFTENVGARFASYGWHVQSVDDGNDLAAVDKALRVAQETLERPSLLVVRTIIGFGAPHKQGTFQAHGSPLGPDEVRAAKQNLGWPVEPPFLIPDEVRASFHSAIERGKTLEQDWRRRLSAYTAAFPELGSELARRLAGELPLRWDADLPVFAADSKGVATRKASEATLQVLASRLPELIGGSADLDESTYTWLKGEGDFEPPSLSKAGVQGAAGGVWSYAGRNIHFGVREHAMGAAVNGLAYHGGLIPFGSTFLTFSDYMRPPVRLSALSRLGSIWVYTHDSVGIGEDGPTHQPVEHFIALRAIPELLFIRPADANETVWAWRVAIGNRNRPTVLALTRQAVPTLDRSVYGSAEGLTRGAYVLNVRSESSRQPDIILIATGSEVQLIVTAEGRLAARGVKVRLVSMPCGELFEEQTPEYRESVLPSSVTTRLAVEAGRSLGWERWVGPGGAIIALDRYGASAPGDVVMKELGFTADRVVREAETLLGLPAT